MFCWTLRMFVRGHKASTGRRSKPLEGADAFLGLLVPALNAGGDDVTASTVLSLPVREGGV